MLQLEPDKDKMCGQMLPCTKGLVMSNDVNKDWSPQNKVQGKAWGLKAKEWNFKAKSKTRK